MLVSGARFVAICNKRKMVLEWWRLQKAEFRSANFQLGRNSRVSTFHLLFYQL